jgi:lysophospholipase L1-like esterase
MKRIKCSLAIAVLALAGFATGAVAQVSISGGSSARWVASWGSPPMPANTAPVPEGTPQTLENQTVRHVAHLSIGGSKVRVRVSNEYGAGELRLGAAHFALHAGGDSIAAGTGRPLTFSGQRSIIIPMGAAALSDPVDFNLPSQSNVVVSVYLPDATGDVTTHASGDQSTFISGAGDFTASADFPTAQTVISRYFLTAIETWTADNPGGIVALGDSIGEGFMSTVNENRRWTDVLSHRLNPRYGRARFGVVNQSIGCSRLLRFICGPSGSERFDRDVLAVSGASNVIVALGLGDVIFGGAVGNPAEDVSAERIIAGLHQLTLRARAQGLRVIGTTITPLVGTTFPGVGTPEQEAKRQKVNQWIRTTRNFDAVIDFDAVLRDPGNPTQLKLEYASVDRLHPNDAGYAAMGNAIDPGIFR